MDHCFVLLVLTFNDCVEEELCCLAEWIVLQGRVIIVLSRVLQRKTCISIVLLVLTHNCVDEEELCCLAGWFVLQERVIIVLTCVLQRKTY